MAMTRTLDRSLTLTIGGAKILPLNFQRAWFSIVNDGANDAYIQFEREAVAHTGIYIKANGGSILFDQMTPVTSEVYAISTIGNTTLCIVEASWAV